MPILETEQSHLDARLLTAAGYVRPHTVVADIGCDHGKLSVYLARQPARPKVIAADLRPEPLARAKANVERAGCAHKVDLRLGDGLTVVQPGEARDIVIAGMGAQTITQVLEAAPWVFDPDINLILVPATKHSLLRRWLAENGFALLADTVVEAAGRLYTVINARYCGKPFAPTGVWCVTGETTGQLAKAYLAGQLVRLKKYCRGVQEPAQQEMLAALVAELEERYDNL